MTNTPTTNALELHSKMDAFGISVAFTVAEAAEKGTISQEVADGLINRMDEILGALMTGKVLVKEPDGTISFADTLDLPEGTQVEHIYDGQTVEVESDTVTLGGRDGDGGTVILGGSN